MPDDLVSQILDYGALGLLAAVLLFQARDLQKRLDNLVASFQDQLKEIREDSERRIEIMRERYDVVIEKVRSECRENEAKVVADRDALRTDLAGIVREADRKIDELLIRLADR